MKKPMRATPLGFFLGTAILLGCGGVPSAPEPPPGDLVVATRTTGSDFSPDGYQLFLDRQFLQYIGVNDSIVVIAALRAGAFRKRTDSRTEWCGFSSMSSAIEN